MAGRRMLEGEVPGDGWDDGENGYLHGLDLQVTGLEVTPEVRVDEVGIESGVDVVHREIPAALELLLGLLGLRWLREGPF